jgi:methionyl-tRNA formyltransferase
MTGPTQPPRRLAFAGTPQFAATILETLVRHYPVAAVYSQPARPKGRGRRLVVSPVEAFARTLGIPVRTPNSLRDESAFLRSLDLDVLIVAAYGKLLKRDVLTIPRSGCINVHASLLPRWRGAAPIERAISAGDETTGVSIMLMDEGLDTGPLLAQSSCAIYPNDTGDEVHDRLAKVGAQALVDCLAQLPNIEPMAQSDDKATYAPKLTPEDSKIDWRRPATSIALQIRALNSRQPATCWVAGERIRLLFAQSVAGGPSADPGTIVGEDRNSIDVASGDGVVRITRVGLSQGSGKPMDIASLRNGHPDLLCRGQVMHATQ